MSAAKDDSDWTDRSNQAPGRLRLQELRPRDRIAPNFRVYELVRSDLAERLGLDNSFPGTEELRNAVHLTRKVLQPLRQQFGPLTPHSVYRSQDLDRALKQRPSGWISTSLHTRGCACDLSIIGRSTLEVARWAEQNLPSFDQIICECCDPTRGPNSGWVHISLLPGPKRDNRQETLTYYKDSRTGAMRYRPGLIDLSELAGG